MRGKVLSAIALAAGIAVIVGCHKDAKYKHYYKAKEECILPPNDPRFDNPPSAEYRARVKPSDDKATLMGGGNKMGGGSGGRPGGGF